MGRRPFIALFLAVASIPPVLLTAHISAGLSLYYYFPAQVPHALTDQLQALPIELSYVLPRCISLLAKILNSTAKVPILCL